MDYMKSFSVVPRPTAEMLTNRAMRDKEIYQAGKGCAEQELPQDLVVEYSDERDKSCFNMGYNSGKINHD